VKNGLGSKQTVCRLQSTRKTPKHLNTGIEKLVSLRKELSVWKGTSGTLGKAQADPIQKFSMTAELNTEMTRKTQNCIRAEKMTGIWKSGILFSRNSITILMVHIRRCQRKTLIPEWDWKE
jgi:hypothetical protein